MGEWKVSEFGTAFDVNPRRDIKRGQITPFIPMDALSTNRRDVERIDEREFTGSGMKFKNGDILLARITPCLENGKTAYISSLSDDAIAHGSTEYIVIAGKHGISDGLFGYYLARSPEFRTYAIGHMEGTSGRQRVPSDTICKYLIPIPLLPEQRAIAEILGTLDDKIELNRRTNETLEAMARNIFKNWFVDFGPTRAKMEGREPYLAPDLWALFPERLDDEGKPEGWEIGKIGDVVGFNPSETLRKGIEAPYLDMAALPTQGVSPNKPVVRAFGSGTKFRNGDALLARITPCLENGKTAFIQCLKDDAIGWGSTEFIVMRAIPPVPAPYSYILAREPSFRRHAIQSMTGTSGRQRARTEIIERFPVAVPNDDAVWSAFGAIIEPVFQMIYANTLESDTLAQTRDLLLPKLLSGDVRLKDHHE